MSRKAFPLLLLLTLPVGCAQFHTGRTYLAEMEQDDTNFFEPKNDFPVVAGDTGRDWRTDKEMRARTPAGMQDVEESRTSRYLRSELRSLENGQSDEALEFYEQHKEKFGSTSEKIYFLKLPYRERKDYLISRGFIEEPKVPLYTSNEKELAVKHQDILLGMSKNDVLTSWGKPLQVDVAGNPRNENERWLYKMNGASKYIYFESGHVEGWE